jgi:hypothetical protein
MTPIRIRALAVVGAGTAVTLGVLGASAAGQGSDIVARQQMSIGVTRTATAAPTTLAVPMAVPSITGPAALPPEEQGLPG